MNKQTRKLFSILYFNTNYIWCSTYVHDSEKMCKEMTLEYPGAVYYLLEENKSYKYMIKSTIMTSFNSISIQFRQNILYSTLRLEQMITVLTG